MAHLALLRGILEDGVASGDFREIDPELVIPAIAGSVMFFFLASPVFLRVFGRDALEPDEVERFAEAAASIVLNGISNPEGEAG